MPPEALKSVLDGPFQVRSRPLPIAGDLRLNWGLAVVVLILGFSRARKASFQKMHFLAHSMRSKQLRLEAAELLRTESTLLIPAIRVEPWVNRAVAFASGAELVTTDTGSSVQLTPAGGELFETIRKQTEMFCDEVSFLADVASAATERAVSRAMRMENTGWH